MWTIVSSIGWFLIVFIIVLPPSIILHFFAAAKAIRRPPEQYALITLSAICFLAFSLIRPDKDALGNFSGYTTLMHQLGMMEQQYVEPWKFSLELALLILLGQIFIDAFILRKRKGI